MTRCHVRKQAGGAPGAAAGRRTGFRLQGRCSSFEVMLENTARRIYTMRPTHLLPVLALRVLSYEVDRFERYLAWYDEWVKESTKPVTEHQSN